MRRAHLHVAGLAYYKCWLNGVAVSDHELGHYTTFEQRILYDTWDVRGLVARDQVLTLTLTLRVV